MKIKLNDLVSHSAYDRRIEFCKYIQKLDCHNKDMTISIYV